jgi:hypothetical protein
MQRRRLKWPKPFHAGKLPPSIIPITLAALLSTITVQPAGNGRLKGQMADYLQCPAMHRDTSNSTSMPAKDHWAGARLDQWAGGVDKFVDDDPELLWLEQGGEQPAGQSLLLNPDFVALLVRTAFILLEFGSRPLKNAKKMMSCGLICFWLYRYRSGSNASGSIFANR